MSYETKWEFSSALRQPGRPFSLLLLESDRFQKARISKIEECETFSRMEQVQCCRLRPSLRSGAHFSSQGLSTEDNILTRVVTQVDVIPLFINNANHKSFVFVFPELVKGEPDQEKQQHSPVITKTTQQSWQSQDWAPCVSPLRMSNCTCSQNREFFFCRTPQPKYLRN